MAFSSASVMAFLLSVLGSEEGHSKARHGKVWKDSLVEYFPLIGEILHDPGRTKRRDASWVSSAAALVSRHRATIGFAPAK
jgi:hypothetical protein